MTQQQNADSVARLPDSGGPGGRVRPGGGYWQVTWSVPAAARALRATIVVPGLFALTFVVIGNLQLALFAVFGSFGALVMSSFGGTRRDKAVAHLGLAVTGSLALIIGTLVSGTAWLAALMTIPVAFAIFFAGVAGPNAASGVTAALLAYVLPVASASPAAAIGSRLAGWWLASVVATLAVLLVAPRSAGDRLRASASAAAAALARHLDAAVHGTATAADLEASVAAKHELMTTFSATPYRPVGLAAADQGLASVIHMIEWCTSLTAEAVDGHLDPRAAAPQDRALLAESAAALRDVAALLAGLDARGDAERLWQARSASAAHLHELSGDPAGVLREADFAFHAQAIGVAVTAAVGDALIAARQASPEEVAARRRRWLGAPAAGQPAGQHRARGRLARMAGIIARDASVRSVWFRNSARGAAALAAAVAVARLTGVQHAFWVVLGTLSVLRTSAAGTGATAMRALAGTAAGFIAGAVLMIAIGPSPAALWAALPVAVLVASYAPGTAPFAVGQAAFTVTVIVLFNLLVPAGWRVGLVRIEDVAIGCAVSVVVGILFWPRGSSAVVGDNLADAFRCGADYLSEAVRWVLGRSEQRPARAVTAIAAGTRLDDAVRGYLTEQGSKRLAKADLWTLVMAATRLRLTAHSLASLPGLAGAAGPEQAPAGAGSASARSPAGSVRDGLERDAAELAGFYQAIAGLVARQGRGDPDPAAITGTAFPVSTAGSPGRAAGTAGTTGTTGLGGPVVRPGSAGRSVPAEPARYQAEALWVGDHLRHLGSHSAGLTGPARRLARLRATPWWRAASADGTVPVQAPAAYPGG